MKPATYLRRQRRRAAHPKVMMNGLPQVEPSA